MNAEKHERCRICLEIIADYEIVIDDTLGAVCRRCWAEQLSENDVDAEKERKTE